jgi:hypothetical protein
MLYGMVRKGWKKKGVNDNTPEKKEDKSNIQKKLKVYVRLFTLPVARHLTLMSTQRSPRRLILKQTYGLKLVRNADIA